MKITVIAKAQSSKKPQNFCPWFIDEAPRNSEK